ncbi:uncharacterized protein LOC108680931 [Hyalella azteca]|uniref:Uncharacterized protein LOC108680931 n=1 Tax=Hyalella azteca TaxID=294128 RepID=A0A8B7PH73_HYAAZ|nr:uncharacterized protein LOC108680931 [Hyalella azteca]
MVGAKGRKLLAVAVSLMALLITCSAEDGDRRDDARIIAVVSTWTQLSFVTSTTTKPYTCARLQNTAACRKRRSYRKALELPKSGSIDDIGASLTDPRMHANADTDANEGSRDPKLALTLWQSFTSTYTMLMTSTDTARTFSVSFFCSIVGGNFPPACAGK